MSELIECSICGFKGKQLTSHITRKHKITTREYLEEYPGSSLISESLRKQKRETTVSSFRLDYWINKCGNEELAKIELENFLKRHSEKMKTSSHLSKYYWIKNGYTEIEANALISEKSIRDLNFFVTKYGNKLGTEKYNSMQLKKSYKQSLQYLIDNNASEEDILTYKRNKANMSLDVLIERLGEKEGTEKYNSFCDNSGMSLEKMINIYGEDEGTEKFYNWKSKCCHNLDFFIEKYGKVEGENRYNSWVLKATENFNGYSEVATELFKKLDENILKESFYADEEYRIDKYYVDFKYKNKIVEFYGDFWHCNPKIYDGTYFHPVVNATASDIWLKDEHRINYIKSKGYKVLIIWESDYNGDEKEVIYKINNFLKGEINEN